MPIAANGVYTGPTGSTNATPGQVIRSATWDTINGDVATALTQLAQQVFLPIPRTVVSGSFTVAIADTAGIRAHPKSIKLAVGQAEPKTH